MSPAFRMIASGISSKTAPSTSMVRQDELPHTEEQGLFQCLRRAIPPAVCPRSRPGLIGGSVLERLFVDRPGLENGLDPQRLEHVR